MSNILKRRAAEAALFVCLVATAGCGGSSVSFNGPDWDSDWIFPDDFNLTDLESQLTIGTSAASIRSTPGMATPESDLQEYSNATRIRIDPTNGTYRLIIAAHDSFPARDMTFGPGDRIDAAGGLSDTYVQAGATTRAFHNINPGPGGSGLDYVSYGVWEVRSEDAASGGTNFEGGALTYGIFTRRDDMPITGTASYSGTMNGHFVSSAGADPSFLSGTASLNANFASNSLTSAFTGITASSTFGGSGTTTFSDIRGTGSISGNSFTGSVTTVSSPAADLGANMSGGMAGNFFGPSAREAGGVFRMTGSDGSVATGGFAAGR